jgi:hypothetical protein
MSYGWVAQVDRLTEFQRSVREQFQKGGSIVEVVLVIALFVALVIGAAWWSRRLERRRKPGADVTPGELFEAVMTTLKLSTPSRKRLREAARAAHLKHPTVLLLSPRVFDRCLAPRRAAVDETKQAAGVVRSAPKNTFDRELLELRSFLFPGASDARSPSDSLAGV